MILCPICNWTQPDFEDSGVCQACWHAFKAEVWRGLAEIDRFLRLEADYAV